jgi:two-component system response regulator DesR
MLLSALATLLDMEDDIAVVARARDGKQAVEAVRRYQPDVLITDVEMPQMSGLEAASAVSGSSTRVLVVTTFARRFWCIEG